MIDLVGILAGIDGDQHHVIRLQLVGELRDEWHRFFWREITNARAQGEDGLGSVGILRTLQPCKSIVVRSPEAGALDVLESIFWDSRQRSHEFGLHQVEGKVGGRLASPLQSVQQDFDLAEIARWSCQWLCLQATLVNGRCLPATELDNESIVGNSFGNPVCIMLQHPDLLVRQVIFVQVRDVFKQP